MITKTQKARLYKALDNIRIRKNDEAMRDSAIKHNMMIRKRLMNGNYVLFKDATDEQRFWCHHYFHVYKWSFPNGSSGRAIQSIPHHNVVNAYNGTAVYIEGDDVVVLVDSTKKKVNAQVDFGIHFYSGDEEMEDIKMSAMLTLGVNYIGKE
jgi:hypothetical protein